jgi:copper resistance protein B
MLVPLTVSAQHLDHSKAEAPIPAKDLDPTEVSEQAEHAHADMSADSKSMKGMDHSKMSHGMAAQDGAMAEMDHAGHSMERMPEADHSKMDHGKVAEGGAIEGVDHTGHSMESMSETDHSKMGHGNSGAKVDAMEGMGHSQHSMQTKPVDHGDMEGMDHSSMGGPKSVRTAPKEPVTPIPVLTDADRAAAIPADHRHMVHADTMQRFVLFNRLEAWDADPGTGMAWEGQAWFGNDLNRLWLRSEGEWVDGMTEGADLEVLYGRSIARWWDLVTGVRHDFQPGGSQSFAAIGVMGLAPQKFEVGATAYIGERGQTAARVEVEYELLLTNRLVLQPLVEAEFYGKTDASRGIGSGLSTVEAGFRLRYEVMREFAPYIGIVRERAFGNTADLRRSEGEDVDDTRIVAGFRIWF